MRQRRCPLRTLCGTPLALRRRDTPCLRATQGRGVAARGYKFLLLDAYSQLWILLREYIADADRRSGELPSLRCLSCQYGAFSRDRSGRSSCSSAWHSDASTSKKICLAGATSGRSGIRIGLRIVAENKIVSLSAELVG